MKFDSLKKYAIKILEASHIEVKDVVYELSTLPASERAQHKVFLKENLEKLRKSVDNMALFSQLNLYWTYLSPHLLKNLVKKLPPLQEMKVDMDMYMKILKEFRAQTPLELFCQIEKEHVEPPKGFAKVVARFEKVKSKIMTLQDIEDFRQKYVSNYQLRDFAFMLQEEVEEKSFIVTFFVAISVIELLQSEVPKELLAVYRVTQLDVSGTCTYHICDQAMLTLVPPYPVDNGTTTQNSEETTSILHSKKTAIVPCSKETTVVPNSEETTLVPHSKETTPVPHSEETTPVPHTNETTPVPHSEETTPVPHSEETTPVPHSEETTQVPHSEETIPVAHSKETTPVPHSEETTLVPNSEETIPVPHSEETIPVAHSKETTPVPHSKETTPVSHSEETTLVPHSKETIPVAHSKETTPVPHSEETIPVAHSEETTPVPHSEETTPVPHSEETTLVPHSEETTLVLHSEETTPVPIFDSAPLVSSHIPLSTEAAVSVPENPLHSPILGGKLQQLIPRRLLQSSISLMPLSMNGK